MSLLLLTDVFWHSLPGPVPFTYSAEAFPFNVRDVGMSYATALTWGFSESDADIKKVLFVSRG